MNRRQLVKMGCAGAGLLAGASYLAPFWNSSPEARLTSEDPLSLRVLGAHEAEIVRVLASHMLADCQLSAVELDSVVAGVDFAIYGLPRAVQDELRQLFRVLASRLLRSLAGGPWDDWASLSSDKIDRFLAAWRFSSFPLLQTAYQALHELIMAAWYGQEAAWAAIAYPGPPLQR